jgi:hypothetical protein
MAVLANHFHKILTDSMVGECFNSWLDNSSVLKVVLPLREEVFQTPTHT